MASEIDALDPLPQTVTLQSGNVIALESLRARQFFKLLRIITAGALPLIRDTGLFSTEDVSESEFVGRLTTALLMAIPEAENETIEWLISMVKPVGLVEGRNVNKQDKERNDALWAQIDAELDNPTLDDLVTIIEAIVIREAADIQALGKRLMGMFKLAMRTGQIPTESPSQTSPAETSSADSRARSTSSPQNMDGPMTNFVTFPSNDSGSASPQFTSAGSTSGGSAISG